MKRRTKFIVYVGKEVMDDPKALGSAVMTHLVKKNVDIADRKAFFAQYVKASKVSVEATMEVVTKWVQIRDIETFPYRHRKDSDEGTAVKGDVPVDDGTDEESESGSASE